MKLLTLNLHCFAEENIVENQNSIVDFIIERNIDVCFFQEVAQHFEHKQKEKRIKEDNYVLIIKEKLKQKGHTYYMHYDYSKRGYGIYDEGLAILSKTPITNSDSYYVSNKVDYNDWKTRMNVSCETSYNNKVISLTSVHFGWSDEVEQFEDQFDITLEKLKEDQIHLIAGDFNISEGSKEYDHVVQSGLVDLYYNGEEKYYNDVTHIDYIDVKNEAHRIDYVFSNMKLNTMKREIVFKKNRVSDHFGVYLEIEV